LSAPKLKTAIPLQINPEQYVLKYRPACTSDDCQYRNEVIITKASTLGEYLSHTIIIQPQSIYTIKLSQVNEVKFSPAGIFLHFELNNRFHFHFVTSPF